MTRVRSESTGGAPGFSARAGRSKAGRRTEEKMGQHAGELTDAHCSLAGASHSLKLGGSLAAPESRPDVQRSGNSGPIKSYW